MTKEKDIEIMTSNVISFRLDDMSHFGEFDGKKWVSFEDYKSQQKGIEGRDLIIKTQDRGIEQLKKEIEDFKRTNEKLTASILRQQKEIDDLKKEIFKSKTMRLK